MSVNPKASIIITSYNQRRTMEFLFASLDNQTSKDFVVVVADDGSSDGTAELCRSPRTIKVNFVTQPDIGYRKAKIVNEGLKRASADYLIFLDGDVILA